MVVEVRGAALEVEAKRRGFALLRRVERGAPRYASGEQWARSRQRSSFWSYGMAVTPGGQEVDYDALEASMDPLDRTGAVGEPKTARVARSYVPIDWEPKRWQIGLPEEAARMMREGASIDPWYEPGFSEVPFCPLESDEALYRSIVEADRALVVGARTK